MAVIHDHMTPARRAWLETLDREGLARRSGRGRVGCDCMRLGWTSWVYDCDGHYKTSSEMTPADWKSAVFVNVGEALTVEGQRQLRAARAADR